MNKKFLSLVLALVMVLGTFTSVFAAATTTTEVPKATSNEAKIQWLLENKIIEGRKVNADEKDNDLALTKNIQRAEVTKLLVYAIGKQDLAAKLQGVMKPYSDVEPSYWANGFITVGSTSPSPANGLPFLNGYPDGTFKPVKDVTYAELAKMLVVLVKKDLTAGMVEAANKAWPTQWMAWAAELGIFDGITIADSSKPANRHDSFVMIYNAMYKMENLRVLPANETMGIISKQSNGTTLVLNQGDFQKDFTVDNDTVFVQDGSNQEATPWIKLVGTNNYFVGSLVRVLTNEKGVATHIIQLGNPESLAIQNTGWISVADKTIEGNVTIDSKLETIKFDEATLNTNSATRYFVADVEAGQLTEVKDKAAVLALLDGETAINEVYAGYDVMPTSGRLEATVVVFNDVVVDGIDTPVVRVVTPGNTTFNLTVEDPGATQTKAYDLSTRFNDKVFPFNYNVEKYDVIKPAVKDGAFVGDRESTFLIDYSEDNIYKVNKVTYKDVDGLNTTPLKRIDTIELTDGKGKATFDVKIDSDNFFTDEIKEGAFVQIHMADDTNNIIDVVSVVPNTATRGELPEERAVDNRQVTGTIEEFAKIAGSDYYTITVRELVDGKPSNYLTNFVTKTSDFEVGVEYNFIADKAATEGHDYPYAYDFTKTPAQEDKEAADKAAVDAVAASVAEPYEATVAADEVATRAEFATAARSAARLLFQAEANEQGVTIENIVSTTVDYTADDAATTDNEEAGTATVTMNLVKGATTTPVEVTVTLK